MRDLDLSVVQFFYSFIFVFAISLPETNLTFKLFLETNKNFQKAPE